MVTPWVSGSRSRMLHMPHRLKREMSRVERLRRRPIGRLMGLGLCLALAFGLRLYRLDGPALWNDEGLSLYRARAPWGDALRGRIVLQGIRPIETFDNHPALYFILLKVWVSVAGDGAFALRFPSVFASVLLVPVLWVSWRRAGDPVAAWTVAAMSSLSPLYLWYGQEARMYTWLALEGAGLFCILLSLHRRPRPRLRTLLAVVGLMLAMLFTHYTAILLLLSIWTWALLQPSRDLRRIAGLALLALIGVIPLLPFFHERLLSGPERDYRFVPLNVLLVDGVRASGFGTSFPYDHPATWPVQWLWAGAMALGAWRMVRRTPPAGLLLLLSFFGPMVLLYGLSHIKPLYQNIRHLFLITPIAYLLASAGLAVLIRARPWIGVVGVGAILAGMLWSDGRYFSSPYPLKDEWRGALAWVSQQATSKDLVILQDLTLTPLAGYYYHGRAPLLLTSREGGEQEELVRVLEARAPQPERVWLLVGLSQEALSRPDQAVFRWLSAQGRYLQQEVFPSRNTWVRALVYDLYATDLPPSPSATPVDLRVGPYLRLRWIEGPEVEDFILRWWFFWERGSTSSPNLWLRVRLIDGSGFPWAEAVQPIWPAYPPDRWPEGRTVRQQVRLRSPLGLPPGTYRLRVEAFDLDRQIPLDGALAWESPPFALRGYSDPQYARPPLVRSQGDLQLLAVEPEVGPPYFPGLGLPIRLLWRVEASPPSARSIAWFWQQGTARRLLGQMALVASTLPAVEWQAGQIIAQRLILPIPPDLRGRGQLRLALYDEAGREIPWEARWPFYRQRYPVLTLDLASWPTRRRPIPLALRGGACFAGWVCLDRYEIHPGRAAPGQAVEVRFSWRARRRPERPGIVFVHLGLRPDQAPLATGDGPPQGGRRPVTTWESGEYVEDVHTLPIPSDLAPGRYRIFVGWYSEEGRWPAMDPSGERYPMDAVPLGEVEVGP